MHTEKDQRRQAEQVERWIRTIRSTKAPVVADERLLESPDWWKPDVANPLVEEAITGFRLSKQMLEQLGDDDGVPDADAFTLPLGLVLDALPARYVLGRATEAERMRPVPIFVDDLFAQLARGSVRVTIARLVFGVPVGLVSCMALRDTESSAALPLKDVVQALGDATFARHTASQTCRLDTDALPDLFTAAVRTAPAPEIGDVGTSATLPPGGEAAPVACEPGARREPAAGDTGGLPGAEQAGPPPSPAAEISPVGPAQLPVAAPAPPPAPAAPLERLNGVDLNHASADELQTLPGVSAALAHAIVADREAHGPFADVFGLARVPRVGRKTFRKITGMGYSRTGRDRNARLARVLELASDAPISLPILVRSVAERRGLAGCVMSDADGLLLAECGAGDLAAALSAIVPRLVAQVSENIRELGGQEVNSVSVAYGARRLTVVAAGSVCLTVIHAADRLTTGTHRFLHEVAMEVAWWFSRRGYVHGNARFGEVHRV